MIQRWVVALTRVLFVIVAVLAVAKLTSRAYDDNGFGDHVMFYRASRAMLEGETPYQHGYLYLPLLAFLMTPLALLPAPIYGFVWGVLIGVLWILVRSLIRELLKREKDDLHWTADILPSVLLFRYIYNGWGLGQITLVLVVLAFFALIYNRRGDEVRSAFFLALAAAIKLFPAFIAIVFVAHRRWRALVWAILFGVLLTLLPILETGPHRFLELVRDGFIGTAGRVLEIKGMDPSHTGLIAALWSRAGGGPTPVLLFLQLAWIAACALLILRHRPTDTLRTDERLWLGLVVTSMLVASPYISKNYLAFLLLPFAASVQYIVEAPFESVAARWLKAGLVVATFAFNFYSPWLLGRELSTAVERAISPITIGLVLYWLSLLRALGCSHSERVEG